AEKAIVDDRLLQELLAGISSEQKNTPEKEKCNKVLRMISEEHPEAIYDQWDRFAAMLKCDNAFSQFPAVYLLANLVAVDRENKFEALVEDYFSLLDSGPVSVAAHVALNAPKIARAKPGLREIIIERLLSIEAPGLEQGRRDLVKAYAIESLDAMYESSTQKAAIINFATDLQTSSSPKARKAADKFLKKHKA
ncbi:MAG TPA: hypothetical protein VGJ92_03820, partial [Methanocella sp.]